MKKIILSIVGVLCVALIIVGATYAYFLTGVNGNSGLAAGNATNYDIIFTKVSDFEGTLDPGTTRNDDVYSVVRIKVAGNTARVEANLYINIENISSSIATSALKWEFVATKNGSNVTITPSSGDFASCNHGGILEACESGDKLYIVTNYLLDYTDTEFTVYIWLDANLLDGNVADAVLEASIGADTENFTGGVVPEEYQQVEFVHFSGAQLINLGVSPNTYGGNYSVEIEEKHANNSSNMYIFATTTGTTNATSRGNIRIDSGGTKCFAIVNSSDNNSTTSISLTALVVNSKNYIRHTVSTTNTMRELQVNSSTTSSTTAFVSKSTTTFKIGGITNTPTYVGDIYYLKLYGNGNLVRYMIPCYRRSDGKVGFYDTKNNVFYTNTRTGADLTAGAEIQSGR